MRSSETMTSTRWTSCGVFRRSQYLAWAAVSYLSGDTLCPGCAGANTKLLRRKWLVTALYECSNCALRFRFPKDAIHAARDFYQHTYEQGFTTRLPTEEELEQLTASRFTGHEKDYRAYIRILEAAGIVPPASILDFGASWGYGSWQLQAAGYEVFAYEVGAKRARFAASALGVTVIDDPRDPPRPVDCFFSAHVLEHLANPNELWQVARAALKSQGTFIAFVPNGNPERERVEADNYHRLWGQVHPLLVTPEYLLSASARHGFRASVYSSPYALETIRQRCSGDRLDGAELAVIGWRLP